MDFMEMEFESSANPTPKKRERKPKAEMEASSPPLPRTRSKVALDWTTSELIILANEISSVKDDCYRALSSCQKWKMVVDNCTAFGVRRTLNQCKNKWRSLVSEFHQIKHWDSKSISDSYWDLDCEMRKQFQLPENFDNNLFKAIGDHVKAHQDDTDIAPDTNADAEGEKDLLDVIATLRSKRQRRQSVSQKIELEEKDQDICVLELAEEGNHKSCEEANPLMCSESETQVKYGEQEPRRSHLEENEESNPQMCLESESLHVRYAEQEPQESHLDENEEENPHMSFQSETPQVQYCEVRLSHLDENEEVNPQRSHFKNEPNAYMGFESETQVQYGEQGNPQESCRNGNPLTINVEEEPRNSRKGKSKKIIRPRTKKVMGKKEEEHLMVKNLRQNAKKILEVVQGNLPETAEYGATNTKSAQDVQIDFARQQGDSLIACLGNIVSILDKFPYLIRESN